MSVLGKYFHTIRHLRLVQLYGRLWYTLHKPRIDISPAPPLRRTSGPWVPPLRREPSLLRPFVFRFLNEEHALATPLDWDPPRVAKLWRYNLHYFDDLNAQACEQRYEWHKEWLQRWVEENPPAQGTGWEPYPTSLRIVNWIKWTLAGNELSPECLQSLAIQVRWLGCRLETHLLGNHLFANAKALVYAGLFFDGREAAQWLERGLAILAREIPEQILSDGGQFERSTMYHSLALEDMLDLMNMTTAFRQALPQHRVFAIDGWRSFVVRMTHWAMVMRHPDGEISFFNDAAFGIAPPPNVLSDYALRLGLSCPDLPSSGVVHLDVSGYIRIQAGPIVALLDVGPIGPDYLPGHAHADTLSFELSLADQRLFVNSGTSCYGIGGERLRQRGTAAHNTVLVDGEDSSEVWGGFRVARRATPSKPTFGRQPPCYEIATSHDGYMRLPGKNVHRRQWRCDEQSFIIEDEVTGAFGEAEARFHLHPEVQADTRRLDEGEIILQLPNGLEAVFTVTDGQLQVSPSTWHPMFGVSHPNLCVRVKFRSSKIRTVLVWRGEIS